MRRLLLILILLQTTTSYSQYYLRGEVKDLTNQPLQGVRITLVSKGSYPFYSGSTGAFGIPLSVKIDTIVFQAEGFEILKTAVETSQYSVFKLRPVGTAATTLHPRLSSLSKSLLDEKARYPTVMGESYSSTVENSFIETGKYPQTGYAINVDRACYSNIRRFLNTRGKPPVDAVRIEEMLNYFNLSTTNEAPVNETFAAHTNLTTCPWNEGNQLLFINLQARKINLDKTPPSNLVFLIDVSGSMDMPNRLPLLQSAFKLLVENLRAKDTVSIITYGGVVAVVLQPTSGDKKQKIIEAIENLRPAGSTPGESAVRLAYKFAANTFIKGGNNRVILATDGDFNVGQTSEDELEKLIDQQRKTGIFLTCLGVGMGNYKDSKLEALAKKGNGNFAYIDNEQEAEKVLVEEFAQTVYTVASDVYLTINFNPALVKSYRLIGFDNRQSAIVDTSSEIEGGEVGSGHKLLSVFEIEPVDKQSFGAAANVANLAISYKATGNNIPQQQKIAAPYRVEQLSQSDSCLRFATAVVMFGTLLKQSHYDKNSNWDDVYTLASSAAEANNQIHAEFLDLIQKAKKIYGNKKKK